MMHSFKIVEIHANDTGKGFARVNEEDMKTLGVTTWDLIEIGGRRKTVVRVLPLENGIEENSTIQIDCITRENARVKIDDHVFVKKAKAKPATKIVLAPINNSLLYNGNDSKFIQNRLDGFVMCVGDKVRVTINNSKEEDFHVIGTIPSKPVFIQTSTKVDIKKKPKGKLYKQPIKYEDVGGLGEQIRKVREIVELPLKYPEIFEELGVLPPRGILLIGPPGSGKTLLAKAIANETDANFQVVNGPEIMHKFYGESEARLRDIFEIATRNRPSIVFIDEIDAIAPKREKVTGDVEKRIVAQLLALMDGLKERGNIIVIGATNLPNALDPALRRPGRFDREINLDVPDVNGRLEIINIHTREMPLSDDIDFDKLSDLTHGFIGADLENLCREAAMSALRSTLPYIDLDVSEDSFPFELLSPLVIKMENFQEALKGIEPSAIREIFVEVPKVSWDDVGGLKEVKDRLTEAVIWPIEHKDIFKASGAKAPKGILLYGPPGSGKTLLAKAIATQSGTNFISIKGPELFSKFVGESEKAVREIFKKARQVSPSIIFFDEIDGIASRRSENVDSRVSERVVSQLLTEIDGIEELEDVLVLAATNRIDMVDTALLRPGRFDLCLEIPLPDEESLSEILKIHLKDKPVSRDVDLSTLAKQLVGYTGADVEFLCQRATLIAIRKHLSDKRKKLTIKQSSIEEAKKELIKKLSNIRN